MTTTIEGTEMKVKVTLTCTGFDMSTDDFDIIVKNGIKKTKFNKSDLAEDDGNYYVCFPTKGLSGKITLIGILYVPDTDYDDGIRQEIVSTGLTIVERV